LKRLLLAPGLTRAVISGGEASRKRLTDEIGVCVVTDGDNAIMDADVVLMAVPDRLIGKIAHRFIETLKPGAAVIALDAAAPFSGEMPDRADVTYFCTHPCHRHILEAHDSIDAQKDCFGDIAASQGIVCTLIKGPEEHYDLCEVIAKLIYVQVARPHRCTLQDIAIM
jgi:hypothetical protein